MWRGKLKWNSNGQFKKGGEHSRTLMETLTDKQTDTQ